LGSHFREEGSLDYDGGLVRLQVQMNFDTTINRQHVLTLHENDYNCPDLGLLMGFSPPLPTANNCGLLNPSHPANLLTHVAPPCPVCVGLLMGIVVTESCRCCLCVPVTESCRCRLCVPRLVQTKRTAEMTCMSMLRCRNPSSLMHGL
jgi:hypothetical protein